MSFSADVQIKTDPEHVFRLGYPLEELFSFLGIVKDLVKSNPQVNILNFKLLFFLLRLC